MKQVSVRQPSSNLELQMKANELEMIFAQYKLRSSSTTAEDQLVPSSSRRTPFNPHSTSSSSSSSGEDVDANSLVRIEQDNKKQLKRGKFYHQYMQKRDAKLREEGFRSKEEKMRGMHESLQLTIAQLQTNFVPPPPAPQRLSKEVPQHNHHYGLDTSVLGADDSSSRSRSSLQSKKLLRNKTLSSLVTATATAPPPTSSTSIPRPQVKSSISFTARRRIQPEILLPPNLSDFTKENTKPSPVPVTRSQFEFKERSKSESHSSKNYKTFNSVHDSFSEQVEASGYSIPAPPAKLKLRNDHISATSNKAPRSFFSLSSLRSKGSDSKRK